MNETPSRGVFQPPSTLVKPKAGGINPPQPKAGGIPDTPSTKKGGINELQKAFSNIEFYKQ